MNITLSVYYYLQAFNNYVLITTTTNLWISIGSDGVPLTQTDLYGYGSYASSRIAQRSLLKIFSDLSLLRPLHAGATMRERILLWMCGLLVTILFDCSIGIHYPSLISSDIITKPAVQQANFTFSVDTYYTANFLFALGPLLMCRFRWSVYCTCLNEGCMALLRLDGYTDAAHQ